MLFYIGILKWGPKQFPIYRLDNFVLDTDYYLPSILDHSFLKSSLGHGINSTVVRLSNKTYTLNKKRRGKKGLEYRVRTNSGNGKCLINFDFFLSLRVRAIFDLPVRQFHVSAIRVELLRRYLPLHHSCTNLQIDHSFCIYVFS